MLRAGMQALGRRRAHWAMPPVQADRHLRTMLDLRGGLCAPPSHGRPHPLMSIEQGNLGDHLCGCDAPGELGASRDQEAEHKGVDRAGRAPADRFGNRSDVGVLKHWTSLARKLSIVSPLHPAGYCNESTP